MIPLFEEYTRQDGARCQAYQLDTPLVLVYPDADPTVGELLTQSGQSGDYITVLLGDAAIAYGAGLGFCPQAAFEAIWYKAGEATPCMSEITPAERAQWTYEAARLGVNAPINRLLAALTACEAREGAALDVARQQGTIIAGLQGEIEAARAELDRLAPLAAHTGIPAAILLRMAVDDLLAPTDPPSFEAAVEYVFAKNAELYRRLADPPDPDAALVAMPALPDDDGPT